MKKKTLPIALFSMLVLATGGVIAGYVQPAPVTVEIDENGWGFAGGDQWTARTSEGDVEHIGCGIRVFDYGDGNHFEWGFCNARNADGLQGFCTTENPELLAAMRNTSDLAYINFGWMPDGQCYRIGFSTQSFYVPNYKVAKDKKAKKDKDDD